MAADTDTHNEIAPVKAKDNKTATEIAVNASVSRRLRRWPSCSGGETLLKIHSLPERVRIIRGAIPMVINCFCSGY